MVCVWAGAGSPATRSAVQMTRLAAREAETNMDVVDEESRLMRLFRRLRLQPIAGSLRRLHCPIDSEGLVLEVGAGGNPYPRANVLLDAYEESQERHWEPLRRD